MELRVRLCLFLPCVEPALGDAAEVLRADESRRVVVDPLPTCGRLWTFPNREINNNTFLKIIFFS